MARSLRLVSSSGSARRARLVDTSRLFWQGGRRAREPTMNLNAVAVVGAVVVTLALVAVMIFGSVIS